MSAKTVCRVCLVNNINLYGVRNDLQIAYEILSREKYIKVGYPLSMCYICLSVLRKCHRFMETAQDTNRLLEQWYRKGTRKLVAKPLWTYSATKVEVTSMRPEIVSSEDEIKMENDLQSDFVEYDTDVLIEKIDTHEQTDSDFVLDSAHAVQVSNDSQTDSVLSINEDIVIEETGSNMDVHTMKIKIFDNDYKMYEDIEITEVKQEIETSDEIMTLLSANEIPEDLNTIIKIEEIDDYSDFTNEHFYLTEDSSVREKTKKTKSKDKKIYICDNCNESCTSISRLRRHIDKEHALKNIKKIEDKTRTYLCNECNYKCDSKRSLIIHNKLHEAVPLPRVCQPEKTFDTFLTSVSSDTSAEPYTNGEQQLVKRNRLKTRGKPEILTCNICNYESRKRNNFNRHLKSHSGEKPFQCNLCSVRCTTKRGLKLHMRTHTGEKPFSCKFCKQRCVTSSDLTKHLRIHTGEKPYACEICGYRCKRLYYLKLHMNRHMK